MWKRIAVDASFEEWGYFVGDHPEAAIIISIDSKGWWIVKAFGIPNTTKTFMTKIKKDAYQYVSVIKRRMR